MTFLKIEPVIPGGCSEDTNLVTTKRKRSVRKQTLTYKKWNEILIEMKNDMKQYFDKKKVNRKSGDTKKGLSHG